MKKPKTVTLTIRLPEEMLNLIDMEANEHERTRNWVINAILKSYLRSDNGT